MSGHLHAALGFRVIGTWPKGIITGILFKGVCGMWVSLPALWCPKEIHFWVQVVEMMFEISRFYAPGSCSAPIHIGA